MKIALTVPLEEAVPPVKYGGTELVAHLLAREYVALGHQVFLLASGDSKTTATLVPMLPVSIRKLPTHLSEGIWRDYWKYVSVAKMISELNRIKPDVIHNHYAWRFIAFEDIIPYPIISTMHGPLTDVKEIATYSAHPRHAYVSISDNQRKALPKLNWVGTVYNGIDIDRYPSTLPSGDRRYFIFLGRTSPEKGLAEIVHMILATQEKLVIAAKVDEVDRGYFHERVEPYIDDDQIRYVGEVGLEEKISLLSGAQALLLWLNWEEPFGLVVPEAYACGTPVIVNPRGSMPEIVEDHKTGFLVKSLEEMSAALRKVSGLDRDYIFRRVRERFTARLMAEKYLELMPKQ